MPKLASIAVGLAACRLMNAISLLRGGAIGAAALAGPSAILFLASGFAWSDSLIALVPYLAILCIALAFVGALAWTCVRIAHFPPRVAEVLTTFPFIVLTLATVPSLAAHLIIPLLFWGLQLALAVFVAHAGTRLARNELRIQSK